MARSRRLAPPWGIQQRARDANISTDALWSSWPSSAVTWVESIYCCKFALLHHRLRAHGAVVPDWHGTCITSGWTRSEGHVEEHGHRALHCAAVGARRPRDPSVGHRLSHGPLCQGTQWPVSYAWCRAPCPESLAHARSTEPGCRAHGDMREGEAAQGHADHGAPQTLWGERWAAFHVGTDQAHGHMPGCHGCPSPPGREVGGCQRRGRVRETHSASKGGTYV